MLRLLALARPELVRLTLATLSLLLSTGIGLLLPLYVGQAVDGIKGPEQLQALDSVAIQLLGLFFIMGLATTARAWLFTVAGERIVTALRNRLYERLLAQDLSFFDSEKTGDLLSRLGSDTTVLQTAVTVDISLLLRTTVSFFGSLAIMLWQSWRLTLVMLAVVPLVVISAALYVRVLRRYSRQVRDALAAASALAEERLSGIRTVRAFAREEFEAQNYEKASNLALDLSLTRALLSAGFQGLMSFAGYSAIAIVLWTGGRFVAQGSMSFGELSAFILLTFTMAFALSTLSALWGDFARALGASERVFELLAREPEIQSGSGLVANCQGVLRFESVSFSYPARPEITVLKELSLEVKAGEKLAIVGSSGAGKSTIAALASRFYDPQSGQISFDGLELKEWQLVALRRRIGVVSQEPLLFACSIADNIRYARPEASLAEVQAAAEAACAAEFIQGFPEGFETLVGERGVRLSGGQKQRVAIARAILQDPNLLILDEATSALDARSEALLQQALSTKTFFNHEIHEKHENVPHQ
jgi:ABC-type multidrug transport system fused ATPase/permease subunit